MRAVRLHLPSPHRPRSDPRTEAAVRSALPALSYERGFRGVTIKDLCAAAEIGEPEFRSSYASLEDAFADIYEQFAHEFLLRMLTAFEEELSWQDQIRAVAYAFHDYLREDRHRADFTVVEAFNAGERAQLIRDSVFANLYALIDCGRAEPEAPSRLTIATAESVGGAIFQQIRLLVEARRFEDLEPLVPKMMYQVVLPYLGPEAALRELETPPPRERLAGRR